LLLNGHLDAGYAPNWSRDPHAPWVTGNRLYGAGLSDMLGGLASMIATVAAAARLDPLPGDLVLVANMHHDSNGLGTKYALAGGDSWPRFGINGEPASLTCMMAHGGCIKFEVTFAGKTAHVSRMEHGADALAAAIDTYVGLRQLRLRTSRIRSSRGCQDARSGSSRPGRHPPLSPRPPSCGATCGPYSG
jgi:acetylornithine deacetylase/succinyl-diaminopimelate desuccinylase-like protein